MPQEATTSTDVRTFLERIVQTGNSPEERFAAAVALAHTHGSQACAPAIELLRTAQASSTYRNGIDGLPWSWSTCQDVEEAFEMAGLKK